MKSSLLIFLALALPIQAQGVFNKAPTYAAEAIAAQTDPQKLATLKGERAANPRVQRCIYWLATAEAAGELPEGVLDVAAQLNGTAGTPYAGFVRWGLLENLRLAKEYGILTPEGMAELRRGKSATITKGQYAGQEAAADHVIPLKVAPELGSICRGAKGGRPALRGGLSGRVGGRRWQAVAAGRIR